MAIPETLVVFITTHGEIPIEAGRPVMFAVPSDITITKLSAVAPGVCNLADEADTNAVVASFVRAAAEYPGKVVDVIRPELEALQAGVVSSVARQPAKETTEVERQFLRHADRGLRVAKYNPGALMLQKQYSRSDDEGLGMAFDFKMTMLNVAGRPDLFQLYTTGGTGVLTRSAAGESTGGINLSGLIEYVAAMGVRHLVLLDYSCSAIDATGRPLRAMTRGVGGKRTRRRRRPKRKTEVRSRRKRTAQWIPSSRFSRSILK